MSGESSAYHVFVKNLKTGCKTVLQSPEIWCINEVSKELWKREKLVFSDIDSFTEHLSYESNAPQFGIIEKDFMIKHFIIELADTKENLLVKLKKARPRNPKRLSISDAAVPLQYFLNFEEMESAKKLKKEKKKPKAPAGGNEGILNRFKKKIKKNIDGPSSSKVSSQSPNATSTPKKMKQSQVSKDCNAVKTKVEKIKKNQLQPSSSTLSDSLDATVMGGEKEGASQLKTDQQQEKPPCLSIPASKDETESASSLLEKNEQEITIDALKKKILALSDQRDQALAENMALRSEVDTLKQGLTAAQEAPKALLEEIACNVKALPKQLKSSSVSKTCGIASLVYACPAGEKPENLEVPHGKIYVGNGQMICKKAVIEIEEDLDKFNPRAERLFNLMCPEGIENYSLRAHKNCKASTKVIPDHVQYAMKKILRAMQWGNNFKIHSSDMKKFFRKHPGDVRRRMNAENGSKPNKSKVKPKGNKKKKLEGNEEELKEKAKKRKQRKDDSSSDTESLNDEESEDESNKKKQKKETFESDISSDGNNTPNEETASKDEKHKSSEETGVSEQEEKEKAAEDMELCDDDFIGLLNQSNASVSVNSDNLNDTLT